MRRSWGENSPSGVSSTVSRDAEDGGSLLLSSTTRSMGSSKDALYLYNPSISHMYPKRQFLNHFP